MSALPAFRLVSTEADLPDSPPPGPELPDLLERYVRLHPALGPKAEEQYRNAVNLACHWLRERNASISCDGLFSREKFCDWFKWLSAPEPGGRTRAPSTVNGRVDVLWMLWSFAVDEELFGVSLPPSRQKPRAKEPKKDPVAFTVDEIVQLLAGCLRAPRMRKCGWWSPDHWLTLIAAYLSSGERQTALLRCPRSGIRDDVLLVPAHLTKDKKERPVTIGAWIAEKIHRLPVIDGSDLIWPYPFDFDQLRRRYTLDVLIPAGLAHSRWHKFHCLRRTAVTQVKISQGIDKAQEFARHFGAGLTLDKYVSQSVVQQQTGSVAFHVPAPSTQLKLF